MAAGLISKRMVDAAEPGPRKRILWDANIRGFGLKVTPSGGKTYIYQYRLALPGAAERTPPATYTIGRHGIWTPEKGPKRGGACGDPRISGH